MTSFSARLLARAASPHRHALVRSALGDEIRIPTWGVVLLLVTTLLFLAKMQIIRYVYGLVIATLAMIESPYDRMLLGVSPPRPAEKADEKLPDDPLPEVVLVKRPPVTSSLRQSRRLLLAQSGLRAIVATVGVFFVGHHTSQLIERVVRALWIEPHTRGFVGFLVGTLAASPYMILWTHLVISTPSPQRWTRLLPSCKTIWRATPATVVYVVATRVARDVPIVLGKVMDMPGRFASIADTDRTVGRHNLRVLGLQMLAVVVAALAAIFLLWIPAIVTMVRVYASLLPETEETIVPFDATFGGKLVSEAEGGSGRLGLLDAWRSFGWSARFRLVTLYVKVLGLQVAVSLLYLLVILVELRFILAPEQIKKVLDQMHQRN